MFLMAAEFNFIYFLFQSGPFCGRAPLATDSRRCPLGQQKPQIQMLLFRFRGEIDFAAVFSKLRRL
jgi:hypothetical protein